MRFKKTLAAPVLMLCLMLCFLLMPLNAVSAAEYNDSDPYDYITKEFNVTMVFDESHTATVTEEIKVNFIQSHHGITR
ncbi:MAG: DUF2207 domain-containing protein, partial [Lachnospiraceae bacterium]|nr:DUF2207 domain-containing protein [Lachnospiraceae bacterium]